MRDPDVDARCLVMTACSAIGMALTLSAIGIACMCMRARRHIVQAALDVLGPLMITVLGALLLLSTVA